MTASAGLPGAPAAARAAVAGAADDLPALSHLLHAHPDHAVLDGATASALTAVSVATEPHHRARLTAAGGR
ncbi:hypothetical protein [Streptomyces sp. x-80]|uniref:hypothetical protein n=1 Tax=Streptomyces sp. x-80 TaxID=2789282 RepID=UPI0039804845